MEIEIYQIAYRVNGEWKLSDHKMTCEAAEEMYMTYEWRVVPNTGEFRQPGEATRVPIRPGLRAKLSFWTDTELAVLASSAPRQRREEVKQGGPVESEVVRDEDDQWWLRPASPVSRRRAAGANHSS